MGKPVLKEAHMVPETMHWAAWQADYITTAEKGPCHAYCLRVGLAGRQVPAHRGQARGGNNNLEQSSSGRREFDLAT